MPASSTPASTDADAILVVETEILIRMVIAAYLRDCGYKVIEAANADEALLILRQPELRVDVVFSDVDVTGTMDGFGLSHWVRANRPGVETILVGTVARAADAAADLCESGPLLAKPYEPQTIVGRIKTLLAQKRPQAVPER